MNPLLLATLLALPVQAADVNEAEHVRLSEEMRRLAKRNAWKGVEAAYEELELLAEKGVELDFQDHYLGAQAARALGDITAVRERLARAVKVGGDPEVVREAVDWLSDIDAHYGRVSLLNKTQQEALLVPDQMPFAPDQRQAIEMAAKRLVEEGRYRGLLPAGGYTFGDQHFEVEAGPEGETELVLQQARAEKEPFALAYKGVRVDLGVLYTSAGEGSWNQPEPGPFSGLGPRLGIGLQAGFSTHLGGLVELGYQGTFGASPGEDEQVQGAYEDWGLVGADGEWSAAPFDDRGLQLHGAYAWLAGTARFGGLELALGPLYSVTLSSRVATWSESCPGGCVAAYDGGPRSGGLALGASYALVKLGSLQASLAFYGGAQTDTSRWYSWGQGGITLAPRSHGRD